MKAGALFWDTNKPKKENLFNALCFALIISTFFTNLIHLGRLQSKIQLTEICFLILFPFIPFKKVWQYQWATNRKLIKLFLLYLLIDLLGSLLSRQSSAVFESLGRVYLFFIFTILNYQFSTFSGAELFKCIIWLLMVSAMGLILFSVFGYLMLALGRHTSNLMLFRNYPYFGTAYRLRGPTIHPSMLISLVSLLLIFFTGTFKNLPNKKMAAILIALLFACVLLTLSKTALLAISGLLILWLNSKGWINRSILFAITGIFALLIIVSTHFIFISKNSNQAARLKTTNFTSDKVLYQTDNFEVLETVYLTLKKAELKLAIQHPLLGVGTGNFNRYVSIYKRQGLFPEKLPNFDPHSTYLGALAENGIFAFIVLIVIFGYVFKSFTKNDQLLSNPLLLTLFLIYLTFLIDGIATDILNFRHLWVFFALALFYLKQPKAALNPVPDSV